MPKRKQQLRPAKGFVLGEVMVETLIEQMGIARYGVDNDGNPLASSPERQIICVNPDGRGGCALMAFAAAARASFMPHCIPSFTDEEGRYGAGDKGGDAGPVEVHMEMWMRQVVRSPLAHVLRTAHLLVLLATAGHARGAPHPL